MKYLWFYIALRCSVQVIGCQVGFFGPNCLKPCVYPSFGERCQGVCNCTQDICNIITGCADCPMGFYGSLCTNACRYPGFGVQCQKHCNCSQEICNHITGCLNISGSNTMKTTSSSAPVCADGYFGLDCISPCRYPSFGKKCQYECKCTLSKCNHIKGCGNMTEHQMYTTKMDGEIKPNEQNWLKEKQLIIIIAGSSVLFVFTLVAITMTARNRSRHRTRNTEHEMNSEFSSFQSNEDIADSTDNITSVRYCQHEAFRENYGD
ncbi:cell death abnormality protein 1-like isoform X2 [Magallana gigas]|uniref:cell death abnormality protein 1-like isoform X2 n=1 Tax=Magallana gigas TaxID=29159 RepID=UPI00148AD7B3|nr:multiple epidermal growth factor-like domains protein 6 isoform X2 [Crassostrea gigas]